MTLLDYIQRVLPTPVRRTKREKFMDEMFAASNMVSGKNATLIVWAKNKKDAERQLRELVKKCLPKAGTKE